MREFINWLWLPAYPDGLGVLTHFSMLLGTAVTIGICITVWNVTRTPKTMSNKVTRQDTRAQAYNLGFSSLSGSHNPYKPGSRNHLAWEEGQNDAIADSDRFEGHVS